MGTQTLLSRIFSSTKPEGATLFGRIHGQRFQNQELLTEAQLNHHVHVVGATGFGKTVFLSHLVRQRIEQGRGLVFIDLKADRSTIDRFVKYAEAAGRSQDVRIFSLTEESTSANYNVIAGASANQLRDRIVKALNWSEEYYKNQSASFLLKTLIGLCWLRDNAQAPLDLHTVLKAATDQKYLEDCARKIPETAAREKSVLEEVIRFAKSSDNWSSLQGLRTQLESICLSDFGDRVAHDPSGFNMFEAVRVSSLNFIFLDSRRYEETAKSVGRFIIQDLKAVAARVDAEVPEADRKPFSVVIDEFADMASEDFIGLIDRARSSKMSIVVSHQELCDLERISPEFAGRLMGNTATLYAFLQKRPESAEMISKIAGTRTDYRETVQMGRTWFFEHRTGVKSLREVEEFVVHPNVVKSLPVGRCVCVKKYPRATAYTVDVLSEL